MDVELDVKGMNCEHCEKTVNDTLQELNGVEQVEVHLASDKVNVKYDQSIISLETICEAIEDQGYDVVR